MFNKSDFSKKIFKMVGLMVLILAIETAIAFFLIAQLNTAIIKTNEKQRFLMIAKTERLSMVALQNDFEKIKPFFPALESAFPNENNLYYTVKQMETLGERVGNRISVQVTSSAISTDAITGARYVSFRAISDGNYETLRRYLQELGKAPFFAKIDSLNITGLPSINNQSRADLSGTLYIQ